MCTEYFSILSHNLEIIYQGFLLHDTDIKNCIIFPSLAESTVLESSFSKSDTEIMSIGSSSKENVSSPYRRKTIKNLTVVHMRSSSEPTHHTHSPSNSPSYACSPFSPRDRKFSYPVSGEQSPRRAFQEL